MQIQTGMRQAKTHRLQVAMNCTILRELLHLTIWAESTPSTGRKVKRPRVQKREEREIEKRKNNREMVLCAQQQYQSYP